MAGQATPPQRFEQLRDTETGKTFVVYPVDAREILDSGKGRYVHVQTCTDAGEPHPSFRSAAPPAAASPAPAAPATPALSTSGQPIAPTELKVAAASAPAAPASADPGTPASAPVADQFPPIEELAAALAQITDGEKILGMQAQDQRRSAQPIYEARLTELTAPGS